MDLIRRQDAIDACLRVRELRAYDEIEEIKALPSAEPEIIRCEYCAYWHDSGKCDYFSIPERNIEVHMDKDGFCSEVERKASDEY